MVLLVCRLASPVLGTGGPRGPAPVLTRELQTERKTEEKSGTGGGDDGEGGGGHQTQSRCCFIRCSSYTFVFKAAGDRRQEGKSELLLCHVTPPPPQMKRPANSIKTDWWDVIEPEVKSCHCLTNYAPQSDNRRTVVLTLSITSRNSHEPSPPRRSPRFPHTDDLHWGEDFL